MTKKTVRILKSVNIVVILLTIIQYVCAQDQNFYDKYLRHGYEQHYKQRGWRLYRTLPEEVNVYNVFDWKFLKEASRQNGAENMVVSPFSIKLLLSLLRNAAQGITYKELSIALGVNLGAYQLERHFYFGLRHLEHARKNSNLSEINIGTKIYIDKYLTPITQFKQIAEIYFNSSIERVRFEYPEETANIINDWCADITKGHVTDLVNADSIRDNIVLLANAVYFRGAWQIPFDENQTKLKNFKINTLNQVKVPTMINTDVYYYYESRIELGGVKVLRLAYKESQFAMFLLLPSLDNGLDNLISRLTPYTVRKLQRKLQLGEVSVELPKYTFETSGNLKPLLRALGIESMFSLNSRLPGFGLRNNLRVSSVIQKAGVIVDEKGSELFAATSAFLENKSLGISKFHADHPFAFFLQDEVTGSILFAGKVVNPTEVELINTYGDLPFWT